MCKETEISTNTRRKAISQDGGEVMNTEEETLARNLKVQSRCKRQIAYLGA